MTSRPDPVRRDRSAATIVLTCRLCDWREVVTRVTASAAHTAALQHADTMHPPKRRH